MKLEIGEGLLAQSLTILRGCGAGSRECVVAWVAPAADPLRVSRVLHPLHAAHRGGYRVDSDWLNHFWEELALNDERVVAQVHTHPREAFHSARDDSYPISLRPGFYSVVIPNFAAPPYDRRDWFVAQLLPDGSWTRARWHQREEAA